METLETENFGNEKTFSRTVQTTSEKQKETSIQSRE